MSELLEWEVSILKTLSNDVFALLLVNLNPYIMVGVRDD